jgi:hypothetical protein
VLVRSHTTGYSIHNYSNFMLLHFVSFYYT